MSVTVGRPERHEFSEHYAPFIALVPDGNILELLASAGARRDATVAGITEAAASTEPPSGKWSIREILGHLGDMERVMAYRALRIARRDKAPLAGIDQDVYAANSYANRRTVADLRTELGAIRASTIALFGSLPPNVWQWLDVIEGDAVSVRALAYIIVGHDLHHLEQMAERFGVELRRASSHP
jgi:DinB family protein